MTHKILTVDDSKTIRMVIKKVLAIFDCQMFEAEDGVQGLAAVVNEKPDLIILDISMPIMSGMVMLTKMKSVPDLKDIPVIMLTGEAGKEYITKAMMIGIQGYIIKPFKGAHLTQRVQKILNLKKRD